MMYGGGRKASPPLLPPLQQAGCVLSRQTLILQQQILILPARRNVTKQLSFGMNIRNLEPLATNSTNASTLFPLFKWGNKCFAFWAS